MKKVLKNLTRKQLIIIVALSLAIAVIFSIVLKNGGTSREKAVPKNEENSANYIIDSSDFVNGEKLIKKIPSAQLSSSEIEGLILMREEEKLARDVYTTLGKKWNIRIFSNISSSEQTHTDAIKSLLERYNIDDPVKDDNIGIFTSEELRKLYNQFVSQGEGSALEALVVGVTIEDLDIYDLGRLIKETNKADIVTVYKNLNRGSRNHMRAFVRQIELSGGDYIPLYIPQS